jgi:rubredoxin
MVTRERQCKNCQYYVDEGQGQDKGQCRFNAPFPSLKSAMMSEKFFSEASITWPTVQPADWCGRFSPVSR